MGRPCQRWRAHVVAAPLGRRPLRVPRCPVAPRSLGPTLVFYKAFYVFILVAVRETVLLGKCITHMRPGSCEQQPHTGTGTRLTTGPSRTSSRSAQFAAPSPMACKRQRSATSMRDAACDAQHHHLTLTTGDPRTDREHRRTSDSHPSRVTAQAKRTGTLVPPCEVEFSGRHTAAGSHLSGPSPSKRAHLSPQQAHQPSRRYRRRRRRSLHPWS